MKKIKFIKKQDSGFKLSYGNSGETSLNLSNEIFDFISQGTLSPGDERDITFRIYKEDYIKAMSFVIMKLPLYKSSSNYSNKVENYLDIFNELYSKIEEYFGSKKEAEYKVSLLYRPDGRIYLKGLRVNGFSIRDYLVENCSAIQFDNEGVNLFNLRVLSDIEDNGELEDEKTIEFEDKLSLPLQQIFYGAPGTGKSHEIKEQTKGKSVIRTTFHPDSDYSTFVGAYKPTTTEETLMTVIGTKAVPVENADGSKRTESKIVYEFVEQAFLKAYIKAWKMFAEDENNPKRQYLVIEEINRGNCAQIFGDLFQLLDRDDNGFSEYPIEADQDMKKHLAKAFKDMAFLEAPAIGGMDEEETARAIRSGEKLILPKNLYIWATMNTSDQSLFPIDSAFKRRWDWEYVPIYDGGKGWMIEADGKRYDWWKFVDSMNNKIGATTYSEDKKLGYFFCKAKDGIVNAETFVSKVIFYIWNDVKVVESKISIFMQNLGVEPITISDSGYEEVVGDVEEEQLNDMEGNKRKETLISISIPNHPIIKSSESTQFDAFIKALRIIGLERIKAVASSLKYKRLGNCPVISMQRDEVIENNNKGYSYYQEGGLFIIKGCKYYTYIRILEDLNSMLNLGLTMETK